MVLNCTLVDIDSIFYTSVQGNYFYQVIFGTKFKFSENQSTLRFHYSYWAPSILLRSRHYALDVVKSIYKSIYMMDDCLDPRHGSDDGWSAYSYMNVLTNRCLMGSTDQADPSCFYFRISWILMQQLCFYFFLPLHFVQGLRSKNVK